MEKTKKKKAETEICIGHVAVDSGQLMICDPCYIDSEWKHENFEDIRVYVHKDTGKKLQYRVDFGNYEEVIPDYEMTMNELIKTGEWVEKKEHVVKHGFSYNACAKATLSKNGHGELHFGLGHPGAGIAFGTAFGDGLYPVFAKYDADGNIKSVTVELQ